MPPEAVGRHDLTQGFEFMHSWLHACWDALVDDVGIDQAVAGFEKVGRNAGAAGGLNLMNWGLAKDEQPSSLVTGLCYSGRMIGWGVAEMTADEEIGCMRIPDCRLGPGRHPYCPGHCGPLMETMMDTMRPGYDIQLLSCLGNGDRECLMLVKPKHKGLTIEDLHRRRMRPIPIPAIPEQMRLQIVPNYLHWSWIFVVTSAFNTMGIEKAMEMLLPIMREEGMKFPKDGLPPEESIALVLRKMTAVARVAAVHGGHEVTIEECPIIGHPPEVCALLHAFFSGMAEEAGVKESKWLEMAIGGSRICRLKLEAARPSTHLDQMLETLQERLVRGEISFEDYTRIKNEISSERH
jgi:predicted hydrocarbon binding protein